MKIINLAAMLLICGCTLEPAITVEVPEGAIQRNTSINVEWPDVVEYFADQIETKAECEFNKLPENEHGFIGKCISNCCLWIYNDGSCVERWCLSLESVCGWELTDWNCLEGR